MFQVGEYVVCGSRAVCRVEAIGPLRFKECGGGEYYTLCPPFTSSTIIDRWIPPCPSVGS